MITLRNYQLRCVDALVANRRGIVKSPAGSGKTIIGAAALAKYTPPRARLSKRKLRVAWIANTNEQCEQARKAMAIFPTIDQHNIVTVACYASNISLASFDIIIFDECHHVAAPQARQMAGMNNNVRWGLSATPERADDLKDDVFEIIGPIVAEVDREELIDAGQLAKAKVTFHQPNNPKEMEGQVRKECEPKFEAMRRKYAGLIAMKRIDPEEQERRIVWQSVLEIGIKWNQKRNRLITELANQHTTQGDSTLIIIGSIEHGEMLKEHVPNSEIVFSKMGAKKRRETLAAFAAGDIPTIFATSLADEGLDVPRANVLIQAAGGRSAAKAEQRTGRVLRTFHDKTHGTIHDFMDCQHYFLLAQSKRRAAVYRELSYDIQYPQTPLFAISAT